MTSDESERRNCQSRTVFEHQENKNPTTEETHNINIGNEETEVVKGLLTLVSHQFKWRL